MPQGDPPLPSQLLTLSGDLRWKDDETAKAMLEELRAIRQLLEKINQRQELEEAPRIAVMRKYLARSNPSATL